ncbi:helicase HerA domain-containing protein [Sphingorhabdus sp. Alg231-15]|uniref:helicase HerA domain-containing protein n=1 Tax=Sphingorhabdus sp. Alg231-15 TaxID=1922222 RepID=UPI000D55E7F9
MKYRKVLTETRFRTNAQNSFNVDPKSKALIVGSRNANPNQSAFFGKVLEQSRTGSLLDHNVFVDVSFPHVIGIFGSRGSGKSYDLGVLLEGLIPPNDLDSDGSAIVFDIQDQFWTLAYKPNKNVPGDQSQCEEITRWGLQGDCLKDVKVWIPASSDTQVPGAIPFTLSSSQLTFSDWLAILELERFSPMGQALQTLLNQTKKLTPTELADHCNIKGPLSSHQQSTIDGLRWRLESLDDAEIIGPDGISVDELLSKGALTVILMRNLSEALRGLIVGVITRLSLDKMGRVQQERKVSARAKSTISHDNENLARRLWMVLDEAHVLIPAEGSTAATEPLIDYVKRGRDAGLSLIFATQQPSAVDSKLMSQVDLTITHTLGFDTDLNAASARMPTRKAFSYEIDGHDGANTSDLIRSLQPGECVIADSASTRIFVARVRPRSSAHGGTTPE